MLLGAAILSAIPLSSYSKREDSSQNTGLMISALRSAFVPVYADVIPDTGINLRFTLDFGWVDVAVLDSYGSVVYSESVCTSSAPQAFIDTFGYPSDMYTVVVQDQSGYVIYWDSFSL
ncbi:MAG: hypothetical protein E6772_16115 [Dysgonomonas sp.]|nr:hypothetical protein [Dysgonomonas sp.]